MTLVSIALMSLLLLSGCASRVVVPNDPGGRRAARCAEQASAAVPSAWTIVEEMAEKSSYPTLTKAHMATLMYWPTGFGLGWLAIREGKQRHYEAAFDRCLVETMPGPTVEK